MKILPKLAVVLTGLTLSVAAIYAKTDEAAHQYSEFHVGSLVSGPAVGDTKGKAVLIDAWGTHCGPCLALLPEVEKISKRYKDKMVVIGAECQGSSNDQINDVVKKNHLTYSITSGMQGPVQFSGLPHVFVFDTTGKLLYTGSPFEKEFEHALHRAVAAGGSSSASNDSGFSTAFPGH